jgi:aryl-alcohol dehydrogenase-like predicted oxidoreductase
VTFFDTADVYNGGESEMLTGRILGKLLEREEFVI